MLFGLLKDRPSRSPRPVRRTRLLLERLEERDCPSAPAVETLYAAPTSSGKQVSVTGSVITDHPGNTTVTLSGVVSGTATTDSYGNFSWGGTASSLGTVTAVATDTVEALDSFSVDATLACSAPVINNFQATTVGPYMPGWYKISGQVNAPAPGGLTVTFDGLASGKTATTDANGNFSIVIQVLQHGMITAETTDAWGQNSNVACTTV